MKFIYVTIFVLIFCSFYTGSVFADPPIASGQLSSAFSSWGNDSLTGDWAIVTDGNDYYLQLGDNFEAKKGPDVKIFLSPAKNTDITGDNAANGSLFIKLLDDFNGPIRLKIPAGTDISDYQSLVFHCVEYSKLWGVSPLQ